MATGLPLVGSTVTVYFAGTTTLATLYAANDTGGATLLNPIVPAGAFSFFAPDGRYDILVRAGSKTRLLPDVDIYDLRLIASTLAALTLAQSGGGGLVLPALFTGIGLIPIPAVIERFTTVGHTIKGIGAGTYAVVSTPVVGGQVAAQTTAWRRQSLDGRWWELQPDPYLTFDQLGTIGKVGFEANDIQGWKNISAYMLEKDGAALRGRRTTYAVGEQTPVFSQEWGYQPSPVIEAVGLTGAVSINGMGAKLRCRDGLRFGAFNTAGQPTSGIIPNNTGNKRSSPYASMVRIIFCSGTVAVENLELDGNMDGYVLGGTYGDTGYQIDCDGLFLSGCTNSISVRNIYTHHHGRDGGLLGLSAVGLAAFGNGVQIDNIIGEWNGRQGWSQVGGRGAIYSGCRFTNTGRGRFGSAPAAGFDLEADGNPALPVAQNNSNRRTTFINCEFGRSGGCSWVSQASASNNSADATFIRCEFIGNGGGSGWALWPQSPGLKFYDCRIIGSMSTPFADGGVASDQSTQFHSCEFTDDDAYGGVRCSSFLVESTGAAVATLYADCTFRATTGLVGVFSGVANRFRNCRMTQVAAADMNIAGTWTGDNVVDIPAPAFIHADSKVYDRLLLRGVKRPVTP